MVIRSEAQWLELFKKHEASGLSAAQFCRNEKLCTRYFSKRKRQLDWSARKQVKTPAKKPSADFIQVSVSKFKGDLSLELGGLKLSFNELPPTTWLVSLVKALQ